MLEATPKPSRCSKVTATALGCTILKFPEGRLDVLCDPPEDPGKPKGGRPGADRREAIEGNFWILDEGSKRKDLPAEFGTKSSVHRAF